MRNFTPLVVLILISHISILRAEEADDIREKGIAALKDSQTNPRAIVEAARCFVKASDLYVASGNDEKAVEMNSFLYWCKKKMTMEDIDAFTKGGDTAVTTKFAAVDKIAPKGDEAQKWFDRAEVFAKKNPNEHLLIAIRFYEVADRFKGSDASLVAQDRSLKEQLQDKPSSAKTAVSPNPNKPAEPAAPGTDKRPVPSADEIKQAEKLIKDLLKDEYAKTDAPGRLALVGKLLQQADENKADAATEYVLLREARDIAIVAGDSARGMEGQTRLRDAFKLDFAALLLDLKRLEASAKPADAAAAFVNVLLQCATDAEAVDNFDQAARFNSKAEDQLPNIKDPALRTRLKTEIPRVLALKKESVAALAAQKTLATKPDDPEANLIAGKFALQRGEFEKSLPLFLKCKDGALIDLARRELNPPQTPADQVALADAWFDRAEKEYAIYLKTPMQERAGKWFVTALPGLTGLAKLKVETRMKALPKVAGAENQKKLNSQGEVQKIDVKVAAGGPGAVAKSPTPNAKSLIDPYLANPVVREWSQRLNKLENWTIKNGNWTQEDNGILGSDDSETTLKVKLPQTFIMEFTINIKKGMRPRMYFGSEVYFGNEGYAKAITVQGPKHGTPITYENGQEMKVRAVFEKKTYEFFIDETSVAKDVRTKPDKMSLRISAGDGWSRGEVLYSNLKLLPTGNN